MRPRPLVFKWRHFEPRIIICAVRWYLRFSLSYRDVEELLAERGVSAGHSTFRDKDAAKRLFRRSLRDGAHRQPRVINTDLAATYSAAIPKLKRTGVIRRRMPAPAGTIPEQHH